MNEKSKKFESFDDTFEDETATATAEKGDAEDGAGKASDSAEGKKEKGDGDSDESGDKSDDNESGDAGGTAESSDSAGGSGEGKKGKEEEGDAAAEEESAEGEGGKASADDAGTASADGTDTAGKDEGAAEAGSGKKEGEDETAGTDGEKTAEEQETDFFAPEDAGKGEGSGKEGEVSYKPIIDELGIEYEGNDPKELATKVKAQIEAAKQELKLDEFSEQSRSLIKHLNENNGDIGDFLTNPTVNEMQGILNMEPEDKVRIVRINELKAGGLDDEAAVEAYNTELQGYNVSDVRKLSESIDKQAKELRDQEIVKITGDRETKLKTERVAEDTKLLQEKTKLKDHIQAQEDFLGIKLSAKAKAQILTDLETGNFDNIVEKTPEASKFFAYMVNRYGSKIMESFSKSTSDANREGYNAATDKHVSALHNNKEDAQGKKTVGHQKGEQAEKKKMGTWTDDLFEPAE